MKRQKVLLVVIILTAVLVLTTGAVVASSLFHGRGPETSEFDDNDGNPVGRPMHGFGGFGGQDEDSPLHTFMIEAVADATGLGVDEINAQIEEGEHLYTIARDAGMTDEEFFQMMTDVKVAYFENAVEEGLITEEHYQRMLDRMAEVEGYRSGGCYREDGFNAPMFGGHGHDHGRH